MTVEALKAGPAVVPSLLTTARPVPAAAEAANAAINPVAVPIAAGPLTTLRAAAAAAIAGAADAAAEIADAVRRRLPAEENTDAIEFNACSIP